MPLMREAIRWVWLWQDVRRRWLGVRQLGGAPQAIKLLLNPPKVSHLSLQHRAWGDVKVERGERMSGGDKSGREIRHVQSCCGSSRETTYVASGFHVSALCCEIKGTGGWENKLGMSLWEAALGLICRCRSRLIPSHTSYLHKHRASLNIPFWGCAQSAARVHIHAATPGRGRG